MLKHLGSQRAYLTDSDGTEMKFKNQRMWLRDTVTSKTITKNLVVEPPEPPVFPV